MSRASSIAVDVCDGPGGHRRRGELRRPHRQELATVQTARPRYANLGRYSPRLHTTEAGRHTCRHHAIMTGEAYAQSARLSRSVSVRCYEENQERCRRLPMTRRGADRQTFLPPVLERRVVWTSLELVKQASGMRRRQCSHRRARSLQMDCEHQGSRRHLTHQVQEARGGGS